MSKLDEMIRELCPDGVDRSRNTHERLYIPL